MSNIDKWLPLFNAAKLGDEETIKSFLDKEKVALKMQILGDTALHVAVYNGHENVVTLLSKNKELLHMRDEKGRTPLFIAVSKGYQKIVEILCQNGSRVNDRDRERNTPLLIAVAENHSEIVTSLLNHKAIPTVDRSSKVSPFQIALQKNYKPIIQIFQNSTNLLDICSCPTYPDPEFAEEIFNRCLGMQFASDYLTGKKKRNCKTALHFAAFYGRIDQVKKLVESGAKVNIQASGNLKTPLHEAIIKRQVDVVKYLITKMADVNAVDSEGCTPLHYASQQDKSCRPDLQQKDFEDSLKIMQILLKNGASVNIFDSQTKTPLHYAVDEKEFRSEKILLLLDHKANINASHNGNHTPVFFTRCAAILKLLIDKGANINFKLSKGLYLTPLQVAIQENDSEKVELLLENGADINIPTTKFYFHAGDNSIVDLLKTEPNINEAIIDRMVDITPAIEMLARDCRDDRNIIPILAKRHFQREVIIDYEEFYLPSGIFSSRFKECLEELKKLRDLKVLNLRLFDTLSMPIKKLRSYTKNEEVLKVFEPGSIQERFKVYSGMMMRRFKKAKEERDLLDSSSENLKKFIFSFHKIHLPDLVVCEIMNLLHIMDWKNLAEV